MFIILYEVRLKKNEGAKLYDIGSAVALNLRITEYPTRDPLEFGSYRDICIPRGEGVDLILPDGSKHSLSVGQEYIPPSV